MNVSKNKAENSLIGRRRNEMRERFHSSADSCDIFGFVTHQMEQQAIFLQRQE